MRVVRQFPWLTTDPGFLSLMLLALLTLVVPFLLPDIPDGHTKIPNGQQYRRRVDAIQSVDEAVDAVKASVPAGDTSQKILALKAEQLVSAKFRHGLSEVTWRDDWLLRILQICVNLFNENRAFFTGTYQDRVLDGLLDPDRIMQRPNAYCSQQSIVLEALFGKLGIRFASVRFTGHEGHFAVAALTDGNWRYFDPDLQPHQQGVPLYSVVDGKMLAQVYKHSLASQQVVSNLLAEARKGQVKITDIDAYPASRGLLFNNLTRVVSHWLFLIPIILAFRRYLIISKSQKQRIVTSLQTEKLVGNI